jgi:[acyl-carrier-protein] S-malonyltransferase
MKKAYVFPGQGAQFVGMGKDLYDAHPNLRIYFEKANDILGFDITKIMFEGTMEDLTQTNVTQPAVFIHSVVQAMSIDNFKPDMVAGHSLGEFTALVCNQTLKYEDALKLVSIRANAMQKACLAAPSTMAAVLGMEDNQVDAICQSITDEIVVAANYNCPGQLVISGTLEGIALASEKLKEAGAKRVLPLKVGGAFHSPLMGSAKEELSNAINSCSFATPICPIYQNISAKPYTNPSEIKQNLIDQLTGSVRWTQSVQNMIQDGATQFIEVGPGNALMGMIKKINPDVEAIHA